MKIHNVIFKVFLMIVLLAATQVKAKEVLVVKGKIEQKREICDERVSFPIIEDYKKKQSLVGIDKCFDDDEKKLFGRVVDRKVNVLNIQQGDFDINIAEIHKPQLFLLYSSLKVDC